MSTIDDTYATDAQGASENAELPRWYGVMRAMVFTLLGVSILAMISIGVFAVKLILNAGAQTQTSIETLYDPAWLPSGAELISIAPTQSGGSLIVFDDSGAITAHAYDANGAIIAQTVYE